jgi:sugar O-acyltransferase (sialic acid O-acetyltransferase NeuD family)
MEKIGIIGNGGQADEAESYLIDKEVQFNALSKQYINTNERRQIDVLNPEEYEKALPVVAAIGAPAIRRKMVEAWPGETFTTIKAELSYIDKSARIDEGSIIAPRAVITTNVEIGKHSIVNVAASISHNCKLGDYVTVGPGAHIAGNVELGNGVFVGIGAIISNNIKIADGCVIGAGAVVIADSLIENSVLIGTPAKVIRQNEGWLNEV